MKHLKTTILSIVAAGIAITSCNTSGRQDDVISNFGVDATIKTASQSYQYTIDGTETYASLSTSLYWPERLGDHSLKVLQDSIISKLFGHSPNRSESIDNAIKRFIADTSLFGENFVMTPVDSLPDNERAEMAWYIDGTGRIADLSDKIVTYKVSLTQYGGGAHPITTADIFSYDLEKGEVLTLDNLFVGGSGPKLVDIIKENLAEQLGTTPDRLGDAGIFVDQLTYPGEPSVMGDAIVFHYNPYDIAPYSSGMIDVNVWAEELEEYLTPRAKELLLD